jgi:catechol 2,3-dioxygenase-like lactoylglutathione lyase family enzyme
MGAGAMTRAPRSVKGTFMPKTEGVLHFTIPVKNLDRAEKFYSETLGFEKVGRTDRIVFMRAGDDFFNLTYSENPITLNAEGRHEIHSAFRVTPRTYEETLKLLPAKGIEIFKQEDRQQGVFVGRSAYIRDPDGNVIEFIDLRRAPAK